MIHIRAPVAGATHLNGDTQLLTSPWYQDQYPIWYQHQYQQSDDTV